MSFKIPSTMYLQLSMVFVLAFLLTSTADQDVFPNEIEDHIRTKRNIICFLGLTEIIKDVLNNSIEYVHEYDPLPLGDTPTGKLKEGVLRGLSTLNPVSEMNIVCRDGKAIFNTTLSMKNAEIFYKWYRKFLFKLAGSIRSRADVVHFYLELSFSMGDEVMLEVSNTLVTRLDGFRFGFTGLGPLNPLVKGIVNGVYKIWSKRVTKKIENLIKKSLQQQMSKLTF